MEEKNQEQGTTSSEEKFYENMNGLIMKERFEIKAMPSFDSRLIQSSLREQVDVDVNHLSELAKQKIAENEESTDEEIAKILLEDMAVTGKTRFIRKIAKEMLKEGRWKK